MYASGLAGGSCCRSCVNTAQAAMPATACAPWAAEASGDFLVPLHRLEKAEVTALRRLSHLLQEEPLVAAIRPGMSGRGRQATRASGKLRFLHQEFQSACRGIEANEIAILDEGERAAFRGFRADVQHDGSEGRPAHPCVRDTHHVLHASTSQLAGDR